MRSRIRSYRLGVSRLTPPTETGSAVTPSHAGAVYPFDQREGKGPFLSEKHYQSVS